MMKSVAEHVAIAMTRVKDEDELRKSKNGLEQNVQERTSQLQKALEAAKESARAKAAFLANMSHELRTPMNAVIGFSSLLLGDTLTPDQREYIEGIRKGGEALLAIIDDILEFSRAEKDKIELEHQPFSLKHLIDESLGMVATQADKKGLNLSQTINYGTPDTIIGDHGRLRQILVNLLTNSVKFTDKGDVSVSVSSKAVEGNRHQIFFKVKDTGIGIPQDKMNEIFKPFVQLERTLSRKRDGVGLGLAITKNLVELMGGKIWAESIPGKGSTFSFTIQAEIIPGKQLDFGRMDSGIAPESLSGLKPMRILVAEDNPSNQRVLVEILKRLGYRADAVADGREVVQALERQDYDLVLMDIKMPEMDGITATQVIRKLRPENGPKIVAITAFALEGDREKCLEAGMDGYIAKPVQMRELAEMLKKCADEACKDTADRQL
jgi:signal transduction histidine kinase/ActR/RegA family two-component response regulator